MSKNKCGEMSISRKIQECREEGNRDTRNKTVRDGK
jgi:hypothetical protein